MPQLEKITTEKQEKNKIAALSEAPRNENVKENCVSIFENENISAQVYKSDNLPRAENAQKEIENNTFGREHTVSEKDNETDDERASDDGEKAGGIDLADTEIHKKESVTPSQSDLRAVDGIRSAIYNISHFVIPLVLSVVSIAVFGSIIFFSVSTSDVSAKNAVGIILGELVGGKKNVGFTENGISYRISDKKSIEKNSKLLTSEELSIIPEISENIEKNASGFSVISYDMSSSEKGVLSLTNETPYEPDLAELSEKERCIKTLDKLYASFGNDAPIVLILSTHATEAYSENYENLFRSSDNEENMISVGNMIYTVLKEEGINAVHCTNLFDSPDFNMAYYNASTSIKKYLAENPSISYIIDVHRDSVMSQSGELINPSTTVNGKSAAQMMFVIGTDHGGSGHIGWQDNLSLAARLQKNIAADYPSLMRPINLRSASFNEQYTKGSLLIEIGSSASPRSSALISAKIFAKYLSAEIKGEQIQQNDN